MLIIPNTVLISSFPTFALTSCFLVYTIIKCCHYQDHTSSRISRSQVSSSMITQPHDTFSTPRSLHFYPSSRIRSLPNDITPYYYASTIQDRTHRTSSFHTILYDSLQELVVFVLLTPSSLGAIG